MPFAPHEIENKKFVTALRGYQTEEVDAFLRAVAADYRTALKALKTNSTAPGELVADIERVMRAASDTAERDAAELRRVAAGGSAAMREAAEREAAELREATQREAETCFA